MPSSGLIASVLFDGTDQYLYMVSIPSSGLIASNTDNYDEILNRFNTL